MYSRETLNPNLSGCSLNSLVSSVLLPDPEGPATTRGRIRAALAFSSCLAAISECVDKANDIIL